MDPMRSIVLYFDFVSPYSWLALMQAATFAQRHGVTWDPRPVVYAKLLEFHGLIGPAETEAKRRYTFADISRCAELLGLHLEGPPAHPFRSLEALRVALVFREAPQRLQLCAGMAQACWGEGSDLTDPAVLRRCVRAAGLDDAQLEERIADPETKRRLALSTEEARRRGVFGVPTFALDAELFWGHDRLGQLAARLQGTLGPPGERLQRMLDRPFGVRRRRVP